MISSLIFGFFVDIVVNVIFEMKCKLGFFVFVGDVYCILKCNWLYFIIFVYDNNVWFLCMWLLFIIMINLIVGMLVFFLEVIIDDGFFRVYIMEYIYFFKLLLYLR